MYKQQNRRLAPYAVMLIGMDTFNLLWRESGEAKGMRPDGSRIGEEVDRKKGMVDFSNEGSSEGGMK